MGDEELGTAGIGKQAIRDGRNRIMLRAQMNVDEQAEVMIHELPHLVER